MEQFIGQHLRNIHRKAAQPPSDTSNCLAVDAVAPVSIAARADVRAGDLITHVDGRAAASVDFDQLLDPAKTYRYVFFSPATGYQIECDVSGAPLGVRTEKTTAILQRQIKKKATHDWPMLDPIWKRGEWEVLLACAQKSQSGSLLARLLGQQRDSPATLMIGAALYELGNQADGLAAVHEYVDKYEENWTTQYHAIARYYLALEMLGKGNQPSAVSLLKKAFAYSPLDRIADQLESLTGERPRADNQWVGQDFPADYHLPTLDQGSQASFRATIEMMQPGQILWICLLANYRANGPYEEFMQHYRRVATHLRGTIAGLHVITMEAKKNAFASNWVGAENAVCRDGLPCTLLFDDEGEITWQFQPTHSPTHFVVGPAGTILQHGHILDDVALWEAIEQSFAGKP